MCSHRGAPSKCAPPYTPVALSYRLLNFFGGYTAWGGPDKPPELLIRGTPDGEIRTRNTSVYTRPSHSEPFMQLTLN